jgi:hypothetical protein
LPDLTNVWTGIKVIAIAAIAAATSVLFRTDVLRLSKNARRVARNSMPTTPVVYLERALICSADSADAPGNVPPAKDV